MAFQNNVTGSMGTRIFVSHIPTVVEEATGLNKVTSVGSGVYYGQIGNDFDGDWSDASDLVFIEDVLKGVGESGLGGASGSAHDIVSLDGTLTTVRIGWRKVAGVTDGGAFGGSFDLGSEAQLEDGILMKWKGTQNAGTASLNTLVLDGDIGQALLRRYAIGSNRVVGFKDKLAFQPLAVRYDYTNGESDVFAALVMGWETTVGSAGDAVHANPTLELITKPYRFRTSDFPLTTDSSQMVSPGS